MARMTERQLVMRRRTERVIALLAPGLDLLLAAGERVSRVVERDQIEDGATRPLSVDGSRRVTSIGR
jgi:hypothetical protein